MQTYFFDLATRLCAELTGDEVLTLSFSGEDSDFVRFNQARIRQAGRVNQTRIHLELIQGRRHLCLEDQLTEDLTQDFARLLGGLRESRALLPQLPEDPHLLYATEVKHSEQLDRRAAPDAQAITAEIIRAGTGLDLVGLLASGRLQRGFANSLGQRNWHEAVNFNFDWTCYAAGDKAVKAGYAGSEWRGEEFARRLDSQRRDLEVMVRPPRSIPPGDYRAYLTPAALREILEMMAWNGFGLKAHRTAETPLIRMVREGARLSEQITLSEDAATGLAPRFTDEGFMRPDRVVMIDQGVYRDCLVDPRSAMEYGAQVTGDEYPQSIALAPGTLPAAKVLDALEQGLLINNLWYCNFSDHNHCRITGMTRFACFWVEQGQIQAPVNVMRFDDSIYRMLGTELIALTQEQELILDNDTYEERSTASYRLPGALLKSMRFTL